MQTQTLCCGCGNYWGYGSYLELQDNTVIQMSYFEGVISVNVDLIPAPIRARPDDAAHLKRSDSMAETWYHRKCEEELFFL